jgi:hypothetical protein
MPLFQTRDSMTGDNYIIAETMEDALSAIRGKLKEDYPDEDNDVTSIIIIGDDENIIMAKTGIV